MFKPMLAGKCPADLSKINYPVLASPKLDGIRCIIIDGVAMSRSLKPIPNEFVQSELAGLPDGLDGELMIGGGFSAVTSGIMSKAGEPDFIFYVFDWIVDDQRDMPFSERLDLLCENSSMGYAYPGRMDVVDHWEIENEKQLSDLNTENLAIGYEGTMVRDPEGIYKCGRSTTKEGGLLKLKYFEDEEAKIVGFEEQMHNANEPTTNELGRTQRSAHKENLQPMGVLGAFKCVTKDGAEFTVGTGLNSNQRECYWMGRVLLLGHIIKFRYQPDPGGRKPGQKPRIPSFLGFRHEDDI